MSNSEIQKRALAALLATYNIGASMIRTVSDIAQSQRGCYLLVVVLRDKKSGFGIEVWPDAVFIRPGRVKGRR